MTLGIKSKNDCRRPRAIVAERLLINVSPSSGRPIFEQIREQIRDFVIDGRLQPGMRLPPVRTLAQQLGVNQITVAKAYRGLAESKLIEGKRGAGSFVRTFEDFSWRETVSITPTRPLLAERLSELARAPGVIAFSSNYPLVDQQSIEEFRNCLATAAVDKLAGCYSYDPPLGRAALRKQIQIYMKRQGIYVNQDDVMVTSGAQQAIDLVARALIQPGASVAIEQPAYYGAINSLRGARARILEVPVERDGMNLDILERYLIGDRVRLIYTNPTFQNPSGITMSEDKRRALLALARRFGAVILEDDHARELRFVGEEVPAIRALAGEDDLVFYARSLGKTILPGMRLGYLVMPDMLRKRLLTTKTVLDLHCNSFIQEAAALYLERNSHVGALKRICTTYGPRQRLLHERLVAGMPAGTTVSNPDGGLSLWVTFPEGVDVSELYFRAVRRGVAFVAGDVFYASSGQQRSLRISFGFNRAEELVDGVLRLCSVVKDLMTRRNTRGLVIM